MTDKDRSPFAEASLVAVCAVWGLTFVMVQDAVELIPVTTFLAYRFIPAAVLVAIIFRRQLRSLGAQGVKAGCAMGVFLTAGYMFQTFGLERTTASHAGFITGLFVVLLAAINVRGLARSAGLISIATLASRLLGVVRETVLAYYFGASAAMDAYNVAFRIPNLLRDLFAEGALSSAFVEVADLTPELTIAEVHLGQVPPCGGSVGGHRVQTQWTIDAGMTAVRHEFVRGHPLSCPG